MSTALREALDRTLLLMRDEVRADTPDEALLDALTSLEIVLVGDTENLATHAAQTAFITGAILMARSGHRVYLDAPNVALVGPQPPLNAGGLITSLIEVGKDLLPGLQFFVGAPGRTVDLQCTIGSTCASHAALHIVSLNATAWTGSLEPASTARPWQEPTWPFGALAAAALAAGEAFKLAMHRLRNYAHTPDFFRKFFALNDEINFELAPAATPKIASLGDIDFISGGAITNAALFCLVRILGLRGAARVIENTASDLSNLNRYSLLLASDLSKPKTEILQRFVRKGFTVTVANVRLEASTVLSLLPLAPRVLLGVDHIPTRWFAQELSPAWLGIGATTHWSAMASFHEAGLACARCAHPRDDDNDAPIPTVAFVSFWSGLLLVAYLIRHLGTGAVATHEQHIYLTPLRADEPWWGPIRTRPDCPLCGEAQAA